MKGSRLVVVQTLDEIARYLDLEEGTSRFRANAYRKAARALESAALEPAALVERDALTSVPGVGKGIAPIVTEVVETRRTPYLEELRAKYPTGVFDLLRVPNLGLKKIQNLYAELGIATLNDLQQACREKKLRTLKGFGAKTEEKICEELAQLGEAPVRWLLPKGLAAAQMLADLLLGRAVADRVDVTGAVRRRLETVDGIELCVQTERPARTIAAIAALDIISDLVSEERTVRGSVRGIPVTIHLVASRHYGWMMLQTTGTDAFVAAVAAAAQKRDFDGSSAEMTDEEEVFKAAGLSPVAPELREGGELRKVMKWNKRLLEHADLRGVFHVHSTWSDGSDTLADMLAAAVERRFNYVGLSDHSKLASYAGGLTEERVRQQQAEIESLRASYPSLRIFRGSEVDILSDGGLDYEPKTLATFDFVIASVHSRFKMERDEMTARVIRAIRNPFTTILGHMTGRKLLTRPGYQLDIPAVFDAAAEHGVLIEINANPHRLDVDWRLMRDALDRGVIFSINPDAHATSEYDHLVTGVWAARKAGLERAHIFNTLAVEQVEEYLSARKARAIREAKLKA